MFRLYAGQVTAAELRHGVLLVKGPRTDGLSFRDTVVVDLSAPGGSLSVEGEVVGILRGVGVAIALRPARVPEVKALFSGNTEGSAAGAHAGHSSAPPPRVDARSTIRPPAPDGDDPAISPAEIEYHGSAPPAEDAPRSAAPPAEDAPRSAAPPAEDAPRSAAPPAADEGHGTAPPPPGGARPSSMPPPASDSHPSAPPDSTKATAAEKIHRALYGTREDRAAILRDHNRALHAYVLKSPLITLEDVTGWAKNAQMTGEFLKQIGDRKDWLRMPAIALALARNPKTPPDLAVRALDYVSMEPLRQISKGIGAPLHVVNAARKKMVG